MPHAAEQGAVSGGSPWGDGSPLRIRVHANSGIPDTYARQAVDVAHGLLDKAGLTTEWALCVRADCTLDQIRGAALVVIFEVWSDPRRSGRCGRASLGDTGGQGTVRVSVPCVAAIATRLRLGLDDASHPLLALAYHHDLAGAIVAHELGHLLGLDHGRVGLMRERLDPNDVVALRSHQLAFTAPDVATMRRTAALATGRTRPALARR